MTAKPVYNPIESVSTLARVIDGIKQVYGEDIKGFQPGIVSYRSLIILTPLMYICMEKSKEVRNYKGLDSCHDMKSRTISKNVRVMEDDFEELQSFLLMDDTTYNYGYSKDDYVDRCHFLLNQLRSSIECVVFYPNVCIGRLVRDAA